MDTFLREVIPNLDLTCYEDLYRYLHQNPELSLQEEETSGIISRHLSELGFTVYDKVGGYGVVGVLENGPGKVVLLRADMDALPVYEETGASYASTKTVMNTDSTKVPVAHACGHDMHITCLLTAADMLHRTKSSWSGILVCLFQPAEERGVGAQAMVDDDVYGKIGHIPDVLLGSHVSPYPTGTINMRPGPLMNGADSLKITIYGRGGHGSSPQYTVDPVILACNIVLRLQTIVSREIPPSEDAVVTVGSIQSGHKENIIPSTAVLGINIRTSNAQTRNQVLGAIDRIVQAECNASGASKPALIEKLESIPPTINDGEATAMLSASFREAFGDAFNHQCDKTQASEDFGNLAIPIKRPSCYWFYGGTDQQKVAEAYAKGTIAQDIPINHSPHFLPVIEPTLKVGAQAYVVAALTWLTKISIDKTKEYGVVAGKL
ncbi:putative amidohydrolase [Xylogone sp. PMI_703]|nr:putative amidohydrolase [Xylogone sp. PMI_703]